MEGGSTKYKPPRQNWEGGNVWTNKKAGNCVRKGVGTVQHRVGIARHAQGYADRGIQNLATNALSVLRN